MYATIFYAKEPQKPHARVYFSQRQRKFALKKDNTEFITVDLKTSLLHHESTEAIIQIENEMCSKMIT